MQTNKIKAALITVRTITRDIIGMLSPRYIKSRYNGALWEIENPWCHDEQGFILSEED
jgi:hypothetical protein